MEQEPLQPYNNYPASPIERLHIGRVLATIIVVLVLIVVAEIGLAFSIRDKTGLLVVSAPAGTNISISAQNSAATNLGTGNATVHIDPGTYLLMGAKNGLKGMVVATVTKGQTTNVSIAPTSTSVKSAQSITFNGQGGLINAGLSVSQVNDIEQDIFQYKSTANTVTIDQNSIEPGAHNPNTDIGFTLNFDVSIDGTSYTAVASYTDTQDAALQLTNTAGQVVFTSSSVQQNGGD
jgi:hypothetical protein